MNTLHFTSIYQHKYVDRSTDRSIYRFMSIYRQLLFPDHWKIRANHGKKACVYGEASGIKKVSFRRIKQTLSCQITGHFCWAPSEVTCRNEKHHENVEETGNNDSSASGDSAHLSLNQNVCREWIQLPVRTFRQRAAYSESKSVPKSAHFSTYINIVYFPFHVNLTYLFMQYY
jgi:hypothetical protein